MLLAVVAMALLGLDELLVHRRRRRDRQRDRRRAGDADPNDRHAAAGRAVQRLRRRRLGARRRRGTDRTTAPTSSTPSVLIATAASGLIGAVTFWGSLVAFGKLQELQWFRKPFSFPASRSVNAALAVRPDRPDRPGWSWRITAGSTCLLVAVGLGAGRAAGQSRSAGPTCRW